MVIIILGRRETVAAIATYLGLSLAVAGEAYHIKWLSVIGGLLAAPLLLAYAAGMTVAVFVLVGAAFVWLWKYCSKLRPK